MVRVIYFIPSKIILSNILSLETEAEKAQSDTGTGSQSETTLLDIQEVPSDNASIPPYGKNYLFYT